MHPSVRIVAFESFTPNRYNGRGGRSNGGGEEEVGTLPYSSAFERTIAVGALRIYRTHDEFAILNCGNCIQPVMPKSRSWCVDEESSKFVLQIRRPLFWRIELPVDDPDHTLKSAELKVILSQISQFEKTACPFARAFHVKLPEPPREPVKRRPWKPVPRPQTAPNGSVVSQPDVRTMPGYSGDTGRPAKRDRSSSHLSALPNVGGKSPKDTKRSGDFSPNATSSSVFSRPSLIPPKELQAADAKRSVTAPQLEVARSGDSTQTLQSISESSRPFPEEPEISDDSFHSVECHGTDEAPTTSVSGPQTPIRNSASPADIKLPKRKGRSLTISTAATSGRTNRNENQSSSGTLRTPRVWHMLDGAEDGSSAGSGEDTLVSTPPAPSSPISSRKVVTYCSEDDDDEEYFETAAEPTPLPSPMILHSRGHRRQRSMSVDFSSPFEAPNRTGRRGSISLTERSSLHRALSPLPPAANLFSPSRSRDHRLQTARHLPTAIAQKTWEILMSPPSHLVTLILQVAAKVAYRLQGGQTWDGEPDTDYWSEDDEDDYGMPVKCVRTWSSNSMKNKGDATELVRVMSRQKLNMPGSFDDGSDVD